MESSKFGRALSVPWGTTKAALGARHNSRNPWKTKQDGEREANLLRCSPQYLAKRFFGLFFFAILLKKPESVKADIWRRVVYKGGAVLWQLAGAEWQMLLQTSAAGQHNNKTIPLIWHLIPLSTGLHPLSRHSVLIMKTHLQTISLGGTGEGKKKKSQRAQAQGSWSISQQTMLERVASEIVANAVQLESHVRSFLQSAVLRENLMNWWHTLCPVSQTVQNWLHVYRYVKEVIKVIPLVVSHTVVNISPLWCHLAFPPRRQVPPSEPSFM